jgi:TonB family protein
MLLLVVLAASIKLVAQSGSSSPTQTSNPNATPTQGSGPSKAQDNSQASPPTSLPKLEDSTKLEPIRMQQADYPILSLRNGVQGRVWVKVFVSETGDVYRVEVISGDGMLAEAAVAAAKKWKYKPFIRDGKPAKVATKLPFDFALSDKIRDTTPPPNAAKDSGASTLGKDAQGGNEKIARLSQGISQGLLVHKVVPVYPLSARRNHVEGSVVLAALIDKDGRIAELTPVSGSQDLIPAALGAVQQWQYKPYLLDGQPVAVRTEIVVNFRLH